MKSCKLCGSAVLRIDIDICANCEADLQEQFLEVKDYLADHPDANAGMIAAALGIDEKNVLYMIDQRWLLPGGARKCMSCGKPLNSGRLCPNCAQNVSSSLEKARRAFESEIKRQSSSYVHDGDKRR